MTSSTRLLTRAFLSSLPLVAACSTGKPPGDEELMGASATGGTTSGSSGNGGSSATSMGGSAAVANNGGSVGAMGGASGSAATGGAAATSATGGDTAMGGSSGSAASGGDAGTAAVGGASGASAAAGMGGTAGTDPGICQHLTAVATPQIPTIELVVDTSSSMFTTTPTAWSVLYEALDGADGVLPGLEDKMNFGFASYKGLMGSSETDPACATMTTVDPGPMNFAAIDPVYKALGADDKGVAWSVQHPTSTKWETPTNYAINYAVKELQAYDPMPPGPKYILLVTDGNPNTCEVVDPQCGQDYAIKATQDAFAAGIGLFVVGVGDIVTDPNNGCSGTGQHCGRAHLQDLANAGVGAPVLAPCDDVTSDQCQAKTSSNCIKDRTLTAAYTVAAPDVGTPFQVDTQQTGAQQQLKEVLTELLNNVVSCTFELDVIVTGDPALGIVSLSSTPVTYNTPDGWILEADSFHVTLTGAACESYKAGAEVSIDFPCDPSGNPIAVHR